MKLVPLLLGILLATTATASADEVLHPPGGTVYVSDPPPMRAEPARAERRRERELRRDELRGERAQRGRAVRGALRRYDRDGDGNVGPGEMPPAAARRLRPLDRDGDGWVEPGEYR